MIQYHLHHKHLIQQIKSPTTQVCELEMNVLILVIAVDIPNLNCAIRKAIEQFY